MYAYTHTAPEVGDCEDMSSEEGSDIYEEGILEEDILETLSMSSEEDIEGLVQGMNKYPSDPAIQKWACRRLWRIAHTGDDKKRVEIANLGGIEALLKAMKEHASEAKVQEYACGALLVPGIPVDEGLAGNADNKALIKREGGEEVVRRAMAAANATDNTKDYGLALLSHLS